MCDNIFNTNGTYIETGLIVLWLASLCISRGFSVCHLACQPLCFHLPSLSLERHRLCSHRSFLRWLCPHLLLWCPRSLPFAAAEMWLGAPLDLILHLGHCGSDDMGKCSWLVMAAPPPSHRHLSNCSSPISYCCCSLHTSWRIWPPNDWFSPVLLLSKSSLSRNLA